MPCPRTGWIASSWRRLRALGVLALGLAALLLPLPSAAQTIESVLSPGPLIRDHAKLEGECAKCHVRFDRAGQDALCVACHKAVGEDLRARTGLHGRQKAAACRNCHTDHRGRDMRIADVDAKRFDHRLTDYPLRDRHAGVECSQCHAKGRKYRDAPQDCQGCHRQDDVHKGALGSACADCHVERGWKETRFDHDQTRYPLTGRHAKVGCRDCHRTADYRSTPSTCIGCHRGDDKHKGRYGERCESCHGTRDWKSVSFRHDVDTKYPLRGRHREARCDSCHTGAQLYRDKPGSACIDCHRADDKHQGSLGTDCQACHAERSWKDTGAKFDHERSRFPLRGAHVKAECRTCHKTPRFKEAPSDCVACHRADDRHEGTLGGACADCHTERDWKATRFDHARTKFALRAGHAVPPLACRDCHRDARSYRRTPLDCISCHRKDDRHEGQLGVGCETCHSERGWSHTRFDHATARFALAGAHVRASCKSCHATPRYRDAPRDCIGCHRRDDTHQARFGTACESCHNVRDWRLWAFDHGRRTDVRLEGAHAKAACEACHTRPAPAGKAAAPLERACVACHRRDDVHDGSFGPRCDSCHQPTRWPQITNRMRSSALHPGPATRAASRPRRLA